MNELDKLILEFEQICAESKKLELIRLEHSKFINKEYEYLNPAIRELYLKRNITLYFTEIHNIRINHKDKVIISYKLYKDGNQLKLETYDDSLLKKSELFTKIRQLINIIELCFYNHIFYIRQ